MTEMKWQTTYRFTHITLLLTLEVIDPLITCNVIAIGFLATTHDQRPVRRNNEERYVKYYNLLKCGDVGMSIRQCQEIVPMISRRKCGEGFLPFHFEYQRSPSKDV